MEQVPHACPNRITSGPSCSFLDVVAAELAVYLQATQIENATDAVLFGRLNVS